MKKTFRNFAATLGLIFALFAAFSSNSYAESCNSPQGKAVYGQILTANGAGAPNVKVYARSVMSNETILSTVADANGNYAFRLKVCGRWFIAPDSGHPNNDETYSVDTTPHTITVDAYAGDSSFLFGLNFTYTGCYTSSDVAGGIVIRPNAGAAVANATVVALSPRTGEVLAESVTDGGGFYLFGSGAASPLAACSYYKVVPYLDPAYWLYVDPAYRVIHTSNQFVGGTLPNTAYPMSNIYNGDGQPYGLTLIAYPR